MESAKRITVKRFDQDGCELPYRNGTNPLTANTADGVRALPYVILMDADGDGLVVVPWHGRLEIFAEEQ
jgi:hypothetical protein